jgi:replicative DNA helicase
MSMIIPATESEKTILGAMLLDNSSLRAIRDIVMPNDFAYGFHQAIYEAMIRLHGKHKVVDIPMLLDDLQISGEDAEYIYRLSNDCPSINNVKAHAEIVREKSVQRQLASTIKDVHQRRKIEEPVEKQKDLLADYLEEVAVNLRENEIDDLELISLLVDITKAFSGTLQVMKFEK